MSDNGPSGRGFFATIPGMLTAMAAVITAAGGLYFGVHGRDRPEETGSPKPVVVNLSMSGQSAPTDSTAVEGADLRLDDAPTQVSTADPGGLDLVDQCGSGDEQACIDLLDTLAQGCNDGSGPACDALFLISPEGSDYELYGATCGGRFDVGVAGTCEEQ